MADTKSSTKEVTSSSIPEATENTKQPIKPWHTTEASANRPTLGLKWGKEPMQPDPNTPKPEEDPNHPVHKISSADQKKMRQKGINPALKAEMNEKVYQKGEGKGLWTKVAGTAMGGGWIR